MIQGLYKYPATIALYCIMFILQSHFVYAQSEDENAGKIRVQGIVRYVGGNKPIEYVSVVVGNYNIGYTDIDGRYSVLVNRDATITFHHPDYNDVVVKVDGRQEISVTMSEKIFQLDEVVVTGKATKQKITIEPTDMEIKGDFVHLKTRFRLPTELFKADHRFIVQPSIYNRSREERHLLRPVVIDGSNYKTVQLRHLNFDKNRDLLAPYVVNLDMGSKEIYTYIDSLYMQPRQRDDDWQSDCYLVLVTYNKGQYLYSDTLTIARGTQNVLRYFQYTLPPVQLDMSRVMERDTALLSNAVLNDSSYIPTPELKLRSNKGSVNISYQVNSTVVDTLNRSNIANINQIRNALKAIQGDVNATLTSITIKGYASPEGAYEHNKKLATGRTKNLLDIVTQYINPKLLPHIKLNYEPVVTQWSDLVDVLKIEDSKLGEKVDQIVKKCKNDHLSAQWAISRLPEYNSEIKNKYLPKLRRVEYEVGYSMFTEIPVETLRGMYNQTPDSLSAFEYYKLIVNESDPKRAEEIERYSLKKYSNFVWALNRLVIRDLIADRAELELLKGVLNDKSPVGLKYNQALTAIQNRNFYIADSLLNTIEDPVADVAKSVVNAFNGDYMGAFEEFGTEGSLNEVILLLALKEKNTAYEKMKLFMQKTENQTVAHNWYVYATCANRNEDLMNAMAFLTRAIELDPKMAGIAGIDAELVDIYELIQPTDTNLKTNEQGN